MGMYDKLSKLDDIPARVAADDQSPVAVSPTLKATPVQPDPTPRNPDAKTDVMESRRHDVTQDAVTSVLPEDVSRWRKILANTELHNSALRLSAQERDDVEDCVLLLRRTLGIKTSMNELARLGLLLLVRDVRARKSASIVCAVKQS